MYELIKLILLTLVVAAMAYTLVILFVEKWHVSDYVDYFFPKSGHPCKLEDRKWILFITRLLNCSFCLSFHLSWMMIVSVFCMFGFNCTYLAVPLMVPGLIYLIR